MTTIVYDHENKQVACDGRLTGGNLIITDESIKFKENDKGMWFFTGSKSDESQLMELSHNDKPDIKPDCSALLVKDKKCYLVTFNGDYCSVSENEYPHSIGSGGDFAIAAIDMGNTAKEAVEYAITRDSGSGGKVTVYDVEKGEFI
jgi:ATP-dependent protease HslVU (ClpYQ) peptidase subunit